MNKELQKKYGHYLSRSEPIVYEGITLYPVKFRDYEAYQTYAHCLVLNPIYYPDMTLSTLPRLYFLTEIFKHIEDKEYTEAHPELRRCILELYGILTLVLKGQKFSFEPNEAGMFCLKVYNEQEPETACIINSKKFETLREIILLQNNTFYDDTYIHPDIQKWIETQKEAEQKKNKGASETLEDKIEALMLEMNQTDEGFLNDMSIRRVERLLEKTMNRELYQAQLAGMMGGMVKFEEQPTSWIVTKPKQTDFERYLKELK